MTVVPFPADRPPGTPRGQIVVRRVTHGAELSWVLAHNDGRGPDAWDFAVFSVRDPALLAAKALAAHYGLALAFVEEKAS